jgi:murein DD-endopeptidase MepM/ murein hydrolase activator NlpD
MKLGRRQASWLLGTAAVLAVVVLAVGLVIDDDQATPDRSSSSAQFGPVVPQWSELTPTALSSAPASSALALSSPSQRPEPSAAPATAATYVFPVVGGSTYQRVHHDYPATDIIAACGLPVVATTDGVILEVGRKDTWVASVNEGASRGGLFVSLLGDDGVRYYGSHLRSIATGIEAQARVHAGERLGQVGDTGDASVCHLHFGISPLCARVGDWWIRRGTIWPWSYLDSWKRGASRSPAAEVSAWNTKNGCPVNPDQASG